MPWHKLYCAWNAIPFLSCELPGCMCLYSAFCHMHLSYIRTLCCHTHVDETPWCPCWWIIILWNSIHCCSAGCTCLHMSLCLTHLCITHSVLNSFFSLFPTHSCTNVWMHKHTVFVQTGTHTHTLRAMFTHTQSWLAGTSVKQKTILFTGYCTLRTDMYSAHIWGTVAVWTQYTK